jgi:hypothetical protein
MSYAQTRFVNGRNQRQGPSRFNANLAGMFIPRVDGLTGAEIAEIIDNCDQI